MWALKHSVLLLAMVASAVLAADNPAERIRATLQQQFPGRVIDEVVPAELAGLWVVRSADSIVYIDTDAKFLIEGALIALPGKINLTQQRLDRSLHFSWTSLPLDNAIVEVRGTGARKLAVFSDPDCPYCKRLEDELANLVDVTIYTYLLPLDQLHPQASAKAKAIWCSPDRVTAWRAFWTQGAVPTTQQCDDPVAANAKLGQKLHVRGTPTMLFPDGKRLVGAQPLNRIQAALATATVAQTSP